MITATELIGAVLVAVLGNQGGTSGNGSTRINNLLMYVYKHGTSYGLRFDTAYT